MKVKITYRAWDGVEHVVNLYDAQKTKLKQNKFVWKGYQTRNQTNARAIHSDDLVSCVEL